MSVRSRTETLRLLAVNQWRVAVRRFKSQQSWFVRVVIGFMLFYAAFILLVTGMYLGRFTREILPGVSPLDLVNRYLLAAFVSLFFIRFLFQKTPRLQIRPYLHLPFDRRRLVGFFQASSLFSIHNYYPLLFFVPFWWNYVWDPAPGWGAVFWLAGVVLLLLGSHFANLFVRSLLRSHAAWLYAIMALFSVVVFVDEALGYAMQQEVSEYIFRQVLRSDATSILLLSSWALLMFLASTFMLVRSMQRPPEVRRSKAPTYGGIRMPAAWGLTGELVRLELLLMWRNRRPRHYVLISLLFSTLYLLFMLGSGEAFGGLAFAALLGLFASGGLVLNYGQLMFGWDSSYYSALMTRNIPFRKLVKAKLIVLQGSCVVLFLISLPLFLWLRPEYTALHVAFLFYNAGITTVLVMDLAVRNREAVDIERSGGFFNYEGFSIRHWLWFIPTALPPVLFMMAMSARPALGLVILASAGFTSILLTDVWTRYFAGSLRARKHEMLTGFRRQSTMP